MAAHTRGEVQVIQIWKTVLRKDQIREISQSLSAVHIFTCIFYKHVLAGFDVLNVLCIHLITICHM